MKNLLELAGFACLLAFAWFVWEPLVLLVGGLGMVAAANVPARRTGDS